MVFLQIILENNRKSGAGVGSAEGMGYMVVLCVHEIVQDELFDAVADGVHAAGLFHRIVAFEVLGDALDIGVLPDQQIVGFLRIAVQIGQILFERTFQAHDVDNGGAFLLQVVVVALPPDADTSDKFIFHDLSSS